MAKTRANEREFVGQVISWIKKQLEEGGLWLRGKERFEFCDEIP